MFTLLSCFGLEIGYTICMNTLILSLSALLTVVMPLTTLAQTTSNSSVRRSSRFMFDDLDLDRYDDAPFDDHSVNVAVSALTRIGVIRGNDDGTFRPDRRLNRAEFMTIVMRLTSDNGTVNTNCFPDIQTSDWFTEDVCRAKALGIVRGNARAGIEASMWRFEPTRDVQYEEAVKVLAKIYALPINGDEEGADWYVPFIKAADDLGVSVDGLSAGDTITRGEMSRLTIAFVAESEGELDALREAEMDDDDRGSSSRMPSSRSSVSSSSSRRFSSMSSSWMSERGSGTFDPLTDDDVRSNFIVLGETSPILAAVKFFSNGEPVEVSQVSVNLGADAESVSSILIYNSDGQLLGTANGGGSASTFTANIPSERFYLPYRADRAMYVRARTKSDAQGGQSGENIEVTSISLEGTGVWSNDDYTTTSSDDFPASQTAFGVITSVTSTGNATGVLTTGTERLLGQFHFNARAPESSKDVRLLSLAFDIEQAGGITLSNVNVRTEGSSEESDCTVSSGVVTCSSIPASIGTVDTERVIRIYGDVNVPGGAGNKSLRLTLNDPGTPSLAGDVTWTDGETTFTWLPFEQPVVRGTLFEG